jgi:lipopolysaccharide export system protein LptC
MITRWQRTREWLPALPLLLLLGATYWLNQQVQPLASRGDAAARHDPDYSVKNFSVTTLNDAGKPRFLMAAAIMQHYPDDDSTHVEKLALTSLAPQHPVLRITALHGEISSGGDEVLLHDEVKILRAAGAEQGEMRFETSDLRIVPERDWMATMRAVTVLDAHNTLHAVGMELDNKARTIKLLAQVKSEHETTKK